MPRRILRLVLVSGLVVALPALWWWTRPTRESPALEEAAPPAVVSEEAAGAAVPEAGVAPPPTLAPGAGVLAPPVAPIDELVPGSGIDLEAVRAAMPDNLYWEFAAPTQDQRLLAERDRERARWNETFGRVQAGDASKEEIEAYFDHRQRLSSDYVRVIDHMLQHYQATLSEDHQALLHTARRLHLARLQEIPRRLQEAYDRGKTQEEARAAWQAQQQDFESEETPDAPPVP
ncbi:MAG: hypothetical protein MUF70_03110 [Myxococcota bacterium]|jgi:hypothetical protein|nr:hypothetical protein [Myxococcota bacterium]